MTEKYIKDFDAWTKKKKIVEQRSVHLSYKEREIWWCFLGCNIGSEEDGKHEDFMRPVIIFRIFSNKLIWAIPLTTQIWPKESRIHYTFILNQVTRAAKIHQMRPISPKRLDKRIDTISYDDFQILS